MHIVIAFNPVSGGYSKRRIDGLHGALVQEGHRVSVRETWELIADPDFELPELICVAGGDGTARIVAAYLKDRDCAIPILIYPMGTINLISRETGKGNDRETVIDRISQIHSAPVHYPGSIGAETFQVCASVGPDSYVVAGVSGRQKKTFGKFAYALQFIGMLWNWPRHRLQLSIGADSFEAEAIFICKGCYYAGPWKLCPNADLRKREFEVLFLPSARRRDILRLILAVSLAPKLWDSRWKTLTCDALEITSDLPLPVQADGDIIATLPIAAHISGFGLRHV